MACGTTYLDTKKQTITNEIATQKDKTPDQLNNPDSIDSNIYLFNSQVKDTIKAKAESCNDASSQILLKSNNDQNEIINACDGLNKKVGDLKSLVSWAGSSSKDIISTLGMTDAQKRAVTQNTDEILKLGTSAMNNSASRANEVLSKLQNNQKNQKNPDSTEETVKSTQNNIKKVTETSVQDKKDFQASPFSENKNNFLALTKKAKEAASV